MVRDKVMEQQTLPNKWWYIEIFVLLAIGFICFPLFSVAGRPGWIGVVFWLLAGYLYLQGWAKQKQWTPGGIKSA